MLERLFTPRSIAVIGASRTPGKLGHELFHNCIRYGFAGQVYPVNPKAEYIADHQAYSSIADVPGSVDVAIIVVPKDFVVSIVEECGKKKVRFVVIITAGFREIGAEGHTEEMHIAALARTYGMRIIGPNCLGFISPKIRLNASFTEGLPKSGGVALISQSGAMCVSILDWAKDTGIGFSTVLTIGNTLDISEIEALEFLENDPDTRVIALYLESIERGEELLRIASRIAHKKPIVLIKSGVSPHGERAVQSHTGALAGSREAIEALCVKAGIIQVHSVQEFFDVTLILAQGDRLRGPRLLIVTNAGGPGVLSVDSMERTKLTLANVSEKTKVLLRAGLPKSASLQNPIDIIGDAPPDRYGWVLNHIDTKDCDAVLLILTPQVMTNPTDAAKTIIDSCRHYTIPVICSFMGGERVHLARSLLNMANIPHVSTPERAVKALDILLRNEESQKISRDYIQKGRTQKMFKEIYEKQAPTLEVERFLGSLGINHITSRLFLSSDDCDSIEGFPVVMKIASIDIIHKSAVNGVVQNILNRTQAHRAYSSIIQEVGKRSPSARIDGILVQKQLLSSPEDIELFIGVKKDRTCGVVIVCGFGGTSVESVRDVAYGLAPLSESEALKLISSLKRYDLLHSRDKKSFVDLLVKVSHASVKYTGFSSMDLNPVVLHKTGRGYTILDARILV